MSHSQEAFTKCLAINFGDSRCPLKLGNLVGLDNRIELRQSCYYRHHGRISKTYPRPVFDLFDLRRINIDLLWNDRLLIHRSFRW